jgi:DNA-binding MarR family transcriptional regulator
MDLSGITMYEACLLHSRAERVLKGLVSANLEDWNITRMEWLLLATVAEPSKALDGHTMGEISDALDIRSSQATALLSRLTEANYLSQKVAKQDKRTRYVQITKKGQRLLDDIENEMRAAMRQWLGAIPRDQLKVYMKTVKQLGTDI